MFLKCTDLDLVVWFSLLCLNHQEKLLGIQLPSLQADCLYYQTVLFLQNMSIIVKGHPKTCAESLKNLETPTDRRRRRPCKKNDRETQKPLRCVRWDLQLGTTESNRIGLNPTCPHPNRLVEFDIRIEQKICSWQQFMQRWRMSPLVLNQKRNKEEGPEQSQWFFYWHCFCISKDATRHRY